MEKDVLQELKSLVERVETAVIGSRSSLSPKLVSEWNENIKLIPVLCERIEAVKNNSDKVEGIHTRLSVAEKSIADTTKTMDSFSAKLWALFMLGLGPLAGLVASLIRSAV